MHASLSVRCKKRLFYINIKNLSLPLSLSKFPLRYFGTLSIGHWSLSGYQVEPGPV